MEQLDENRLRFKKGMFTACTQPVPFWSFRVSTAVIVKDSYAHLYNPRIKAGHVPFFYSPYLLFPIKTDRATGLLLPQISFSDRLGTALSNALFWAIARNQDATFFLDTYTTGTVGVGAEHRLLPSANGSSRFSGYFLREKGMDDRFGPERDRWNVRYGLNQGFGRKGRLQANFNLVSDKDYFLDFSRDLDRGSDPQALSRGEYIFERGYSTLNVRMERLEQFFAFDTVTQTRLPEAELRLRSQRLGKSPFYLALVSSASVLNKSGRDLPDGSYGRVDVLPTISMPMSPLPWLDITPTLRLRETYYTATLDPNDPTQFGDDLAREFVNFDTQILGPRFSRVFVDKEGNARRKSTIEPQFTYRFLRSPGATDNQYILPFDQIDVLPSDLNEIQYGVVSRLFARKMMRAQSAPGDTPDLLDDLIDPRTGLAEKSGLPGQLPQDNNLNPMVTGSPGQQTTFTSPVEIVNVSLTQRYSFDQALSFQQRYLDIDGDGIPTLEPIDESQFSPVVLAARINPSAYTNLTARVGFDVLDKTVSDASFAAGLFSPNYGFLSSTWFYRNGLDGQTLNSSRLRLTGGSSFFRHKISVAVSLNYDATLRRLQDQRYRFGYDTQCCGIAVEFLNRDFIGTQQREFRFVLNLRGIGNFLDLQSGGAGR